MNFVESAMLKRKKDLDCSKSSVNPTDKDSKKNALAEIDKFIGKGSCDVVVIRN
ncbi:hypothetical protein [Limnohabitans sp. Jir61]|uniref:hypothetical protein n=1 Tax=Limnohabitans sp. Jir61 TaxID=1826168 RepID=UPI001304FCE9|nr:hypothetical protein [Limnohabitans sp. Jir61]